MMLSEILLAGFKMVMSVHFIPEITFPEVGKIVCRPYASGVEGSEKRCPVIYASGHAFRHLNPGTQICHACRPTAAPRRSGFVSRVKLSVHREGPLSLFDSFLFVRFMSRRTYGGQRWKRWKCSQ
ncbi:hypothetical protein CDAR_107011 [Caerostris darwini]|uniref:Uncharacterized protein n=1 Tax=Caerostris darwini TaxID=1538125 RepID=A0AAV4SYQ4_9ARAC|nr:hypothetical protein CDAR_107011 [Caerostris darwini]